MPEIYCDLCTRHVPVDDTVSTKDVDMSKVYAKESLSRDRLQSTSRCCNNCFEKYFASAVRE